MRAREEAIARARGEIARAMARSVTLRPSAPMLRPQWPFLPLLLLTLLLASFTSCCDVRNDLRGAARKTQYAPVVFAGRVRSRGAERHGFYRVTVDVESVVKGGAPGGGPLRLRFRRPAEDPAAATSAAAAAGAGSRRQACVADAVVEPGERYIVFVKAVGGPRNFTAVAAPEKHSRRNMRKVTRVLRKRRGEYKPRDVPLFLFLFLVVIYRRYIAQCRLKSVGFTTRRKINSLRVLRN